MEDAGEIAAVLLGADVEFLLGTHHVLFAQINDSYAAHYDRMAIIAAMRFGAWIVG